MGLFDILRGERKPRKANLDKLFAMTTAELTLTTGLGLTTRPVAGVCFKPVEATSFQDVTRELDGLLALSEGSSGTTARTTDDQYGYRWIVAEDPDFGDLVTTVHLVNQTLQEKGFSEQLLCSVFAFQDAGGEPVYFVYSYKRGNFYPFVPRGDERRDNAMELRLQAALGNELPVEPQLERWYPVWGAPL